MSEGNRFSVTLPPQTAEAVRKAADRDGMSISAWLAKAARDRLGDPREGESLLDILADWDREDPISEEEARAISAKYGFPYEPPSAA